MNNETPLYVQKYFRKYGFNSHKVYLKNEADKFEYIIVIPALKEYNNIKTLLASLEKCDAAYSAKTLFIFCVNNIESAPVEIVEDNSQTISYLKEYINTSTSQLNIAVIDASSEGNSMPEKDGGVGYARKIGMDAALNYFDYTAKIQILGCLDADCTVETNYITSVYEYYTQNNVNAGYIQYHHPYSNDITRTKAILCYEIFLRFYVLGLRYANSPYGFHTIGSTMNCSAEAYIKIGGMNKRKAAEDFYFMEKLSKLYPVHEIKTSKIYPSGRGSFRVPFGTGQRVNRYLAGTHEEYFLYNPDIFGVLKEWVTVFHNEEILTADEYLVKAKQISAELFAYLNEQNFATSWNKILRNTSKPNQINHQKIIWFDGFRTLKLVHHLRDNGYPNTPMFEALKKFNIFFPWHGKGLPQVEVQKEYLAKLRELA